MRALRLLAVVGIAAGVTFAGTGAVSAGSFEGIRNYEIEMTIERSGVLEVRETIDYDFGAFQHHGIFRKIPISFDYAKKQDTNRVYDVDVVSVKASEGTPAGYDTSDRKSVV